jgi:hypothetical protein
MTICASRCGRKNACQRLWSQTINRDQGKIAILGWGSLLWDKNPQFDSFREQHGEWREDGPELPLEFSRISRTRLGALTLVIDLAHGASTRVAYALSKRWDLEDAISDLRRREGTARQHIGWLKAADAAESREPLEAPRIREWAHVHELSAVVWTTLPSNFQAQRRTPYSVSYAVDYVKSLDADGKAKAAEYIALAPAFVDTPVRRALQAQLWFSPWRSPPKTDLQPTRA